MVDTTRVVEIVFNAIDNTGAGLASVSDGLDGGVKRVSTFTAPLADLAKKAEQAELAITALGTVFLGFAVKEASSLTKAVKDIGTQINKTSDEDIEGMKIKLQEFAKSSQYSFDNLKDATFDAVSSIGDYDKALQVMQVSEKLSIVGQADLATSTKAITDIMAAYGLANGSTTETLANADRVAAAMFTTMQLGVTDMQGLAESIGRVAATASAANVPIEMVGSAIAAITGAGVNVDETMTQITQLFKQLLDPNEDLKAALDGISLSADGLPKVLDKLKEATGGSAEGLFKLFGRVEAAKAAMVLINDESGKFTGTLDLMANGSANFSKAFEDVKRTVEGVAQTLANNAVIMMQKIGEPLEEGWLQILESMTKVTQGFQVSIDEKAFDPVFHAFDGFEKDIADYLNQIAKVLPEALSKVDFTKLLDSLGSLGHDIGGLFDGIDLTTADGLARAIQFIIDSMESLNRVVGGIITVWSPVIRSFFEMGDAFNQLDDSTKRTTGSVLGVSQVFESLKGILTNGADALKTIGEAMQFIATLNLATALSRIAPSLAPLAAIAPEVIALGAAFALVAKEASAYYDVYQEKEALEKSVIDSTRAYKKGIEDLNATYSEISSRTGIVIKDTADFHRQIDNGTLVLNKANGQWEESAHFLDSISKSTGITVKSQKELTDALQSGLIVFDQATNKYTTHDKQIEDLGKKTEHAAFINGGWIASVDKVAQSMDLANSKGEKTWATWSKLEDAEYSLLRATDAGLNGFIRYDDGMYQVITTGEKAKEKHQEVQKAIEDTSKSNIRGSSEWKNVQDAMQAATDSANEFQIKAAELNEKRYEANLTAVVDLHVADVEAQTERIKAAFESLNEGIKSTGDTLSSLANSLANNLNPNNEGFLKDLIKDEEKRRNQEFDLQKKLVETQTDYLKLKTERLQKGDALIKIDSGDLAPELDALFDKVLKKTQIKATSEGMNLLLGLGND